MENNTLKINPEMVRQYLESVFVDGAVHEIRFIDDVRLTTDYRNGTGRKRAGWFDNAEAVMTALATIDPTSWKSCYITLNPVHPDLLAQCANRLDISKDDLTKDKHIVKRTRLLIDVDPVRQGKVSATDAEWRAALATGKAIREELRAFGFGSCWAGSSGNGSHTQYIIDIPNDPASDELVKTFLQALAHKFNSPACDVDCSVWNASRICKLYGTLATKGDNTADRPHRLAQGQWVADAGAAKNITMAAQIQAWIDANPVPVQPAEKGKTGTGPSTGKSKGKPGTAEDAFVMAEKLGLKLTGKVKNHANYSVVDIECPSCANTSGAVLTVAPAGALGIKCHHNTCEFNAMKPGDAWRVWRKRVDLAYSERPEGCLSAEENDGMNARYAFLEVPNEVYDCETGEFIGLSGFMNRCTLNRRWMNPKNSDNRRAFRNVEFRPDRADAEVDGRLNTFRPGVIMGATDLKSFGAQSVKDFTDLCENLAGDGDPDYLIKWTWFAVANPASWQSALVLTGGFGTGKGSFQMILKQLFGSYAVTVRADDLSSRFNAWRDNHIMFLCDEITQDSFSEKAQVEHTLKNMVTESSVTIERKGVDSREVPNFAKVLIASNAEVPILIREKDRRYSVLRSETPLDPAIGARIKAASSGNKRYFQEIRNYLEWLAIQGAFAGFDPCKPLNSDAKNTVVAAGMSFAGRWWREVLPTMPGGAYDRKRLWQIFQTAAAEANERYREDWWWRDRPAELETRRAGKQNLRVVDVPHGACASVSTADAWLRDAAGQLPN